MKLFYAITSPYVRKVMVTAHEIGIADKIELIKMPPKGALEPSIATSHNPLGKIPTLVTASGESIYDSVVICEYLDSFAPEDKKVFPAGENRIPSLVLHALAHGMIDAAMAARADDVVRPEAYRWEGGKNYQIGKIALSLKEIESRADMFDDSLCIGKITVACALGYLDFRFPDYPWRSASPLTAQWFEAVNMRPSMRASRPS